MGLFEQKKRSLKERPVSRTNRSINSAEGSRSSLRRYVIYASEKLNAFAKSERFQRLNLRNSSIRSLLIFIIAILSNLSGKKYTKLLTICQVFFSIIVLCGIIYDII